MGFSKKWKHPTGNRTYYAWRSMRSRCVNPSNASWEHYGGRGITVCARWINNYDAFVEDMGEAPEGRSLDRINVDGGYSPENCRWATDKEQANNTRKNVRITYRGDTKTQAEWADYFGIGKDTLFRRLRVYKMDIDRAFTSDSLVPSWKHGTRTGYEKYKCKCTECRAANTERHRKRRNKQ